MCQTLHRGDKTEHDRPDLGPCGTRSLMGQTSREQGDKQIGKAIPEVANAVKGISRGRRSEATPGGRAENPL